MPTPQHESRVELLETLASLLECHARPSLFLLGGEIPDVLRFRTTPRLIFIGDAKATESPGSAATSSRLRSYVHWAHVIEDTSKIPIIVALCIQRSEAIAWRRTMDRIFNDFPVRPHVHTVPSIEMTPFDEILAWSFANRNPLVIPVCDANRIATGNWMDVVSLTAPQTSSGTSVSLSNSEKPTRNLYRIGENS